MLTLVGMDLPNLLKFKPWGAVKACIMNMNGVFAAVTLPQVEAWDSYKLSSTERMKKFQAAVKEMIINFNNQHTELLATSKW